MGSQHPTPPNPRSSDPSYDRLLAELNAVHKRLSQTTAEKEQLEQHVKDLEAELEAITLELQNSIGQSTHRLQDLLQFIRSLSSQAAAPQPSQPARVEAPSRSTPADPNQTNYEFLNRLKQRQKQDPRQDPRQDLRQDPRQDPRQDLRQDPRQDLRQDPNHPQSGSSSAHSVTPLDPRHRDLHSMPESEAMDLDHLFGVDPNGMTEPPYPRPSHPPGSVPNGSGSSQANFATDPREPWAAQPPPPQGRSRSNPGYPRRGSAPAEYDRRVRGLDEFMHHVSGQPTDNYRPPVDRAWGIEMRDPADPDSLYQRAREQHGSSQPVWVWIAAAFILVIGSFGAGFLIVQPFVRSAPPELPPVPESQP